MPSVSTLVRSGLAVAALELAIAAGLAIGAGPQRVSLVLFVSSLLTALLSLALRPLLRPGGGAPVRRSATPPEPEPSWWPRFERELRAYERERERV